MGEVSRENVFRIGYGVEKIIGRDQPILEELLENASRGRVEFMYETEGGERSKHRAYIWCDADQTPQLGDIKDDLFLDESLFAVIDFAQKRATFQTRCLDKVRANFAYDNLRRYLEEQGYATNL